MPAMSCFDHLVVNQFLATEIDARALKSAFELGLVNWLQDRGATLLPELSHELGLNSVGLGALAGMLETNAVLVRSGDMVELTHEFTRALAFRDLLHTRIDFADCVWPDIHELFTPLLNDVQQFMARSRIFELFRYDRCFDVTPQNLEATRLWTRFTTCLTKYESAAVIAAVEMGNVETLIDLGGNTGEFALRICERLPRIRATVVDLPVVCELGREHIAGSAPLSQTSRIDFHPSDIRSGDLPTPADLVSFKSVLHDWPDRDAKLLIERAHSIVRPGGRIMIFERAPLDLRERRVTYAMAPDLVFLHFLRPPELYLEALAALGFVSIDYQRIELEIGFHLIVARRPA